LAFPFEFPESSVTEIAGRNQAPLEEGCAAGDFIEASAID
jgi:hypothetical protein